MIISYLRVSTKDQTIENQRIEIEKNYKIDKEFIDEGITGTKVDREGFKEMISYVREGDSLVVYSLSRLSRSTKDLLETIETLDKKKVKLISLKENVDTSSATGRLLIGIIGVVNQFEVETMKERQMVGIERAKKEGKFKKKCIEKPSNWNEVIEKYQTRKITGVQAMKELGLKRMTFYKLLKEE